MNSLGEIIKKERLQRNLKQVNLARGICSTSYLSKIENNKIDPKEDILIRLLNKLEIEVIEVDEDKEIKLISSLRKLYKYAILHRNKKNILENIKKFPENINFADVNNYYTYHLYLFRVKLVLSDNLMDIHEYAITINEMGDNLNPKQHFLLNVNLILYYYLKEESHVAIPLLEQVLSNYNFLPLSDWELADFHNIVSIFFLKCKKYTHAIKYATEALEYYNSQLLFERSIDSLIILGLAYKNSLDYSKAEEYFLLANKLVLQLNLINKKGIIHHNLGTLYAAQVNHSKAIKNYLLSLELMENENNVEGCLLTILSIIKEYSKKNNSLKVIEWCEKGTLYNKLNNNKFYLSYTYHFEIYNSKHSLNDNLNLLLIKAIKHFEQTFDFRHVHKYSILLAENYFKQKKYKAAGIYYQKSIDVLMKQRTINMWEDL